MFSKSFHFFCSHSRIVFRLFSFFLDCFLIEDTLIERWLVRSWSWLIHHHFPWSHFIFLFFQLQKLFLMRFNIIDIDWLVKVSNLRQFSFSLFEKIIFFFLKAVVHLLEHTFFFFNLFISLLSWLNKFFPILHSIFYFIHMFKDLFFLSFLIFFLHPIFNLFKLFLFLFLCFLSLFLFYFNCLFPLS